MLKKISEYFDQVLKWWAAPQHYGTRLEEYIVSHNPTNTSQVEALERKFDLMYTGRNKNWMI